MFVVISPINYKNYWTDLHAGRVRGRVAEGFGVGIEKRVVNEN